jgi:hypothetical protein
MNWDAIGAVAELLGAIAVFCTLAYLALQIKQSNKQSLDNATEALISNSNNLRFSLIENAEVADLFLKAEAGETLTASEYLRYRLLIGVSISIAWGLFERIENGTVNLNHDYLITFLTNTLGTKAAQDACYDYIDRFPDNFRCFVEKFLEQQDT